MRTGSSGRTVLHATAGLALAGFGAAQRGSIAPEVADVRPSAQETTMQHSYVGMWVTDDGAIRQELRPDGRYDEARGARRSAYQGRYAVRGNHIDYWDDTGFTADGAFVSETELHHGGMVFHREGAPASEPVR